ncbi:unnamed protein product [Rotaria sp. Silwood2]|nr:unnamed protein product [Rotaria sp. Silwood2]CAF2644220.1 unnamed protein product [Rotaria sp. Silwood2]CAF2903637.1 unnamed protein product [Rotaria sp. Silwood2]CAF3071016.1 unnamed protein product [Rotaria sp. Silwood2]CAF3889533.1 unnamed protein product [Rotaria sp. Silwood2]
MIYNDRLTPPNWPPLVRYPSYYPARQISLLWFLILTILLLILSVAALIIVFAVENAWFHDNFEGYTVRYGLWRLCFYANNTCDSWFSTSGPNSPFIDRRLNESKSGINAWQALEIVFLFLTTATLIIAIASIICYRFRNGFHYYLAILSMFCIWPAVAIGISVLFVFGFSVYNVATTPRDLDWCFYVNLVAVILVLLGAILLSIYDVLLKKPIRAVDDDNVIETFADLNGYPTTLSPSTFVIVRRDKKKRNKPYDYPQVLRPNHYLPTTVANGGVNIDYISNPNHKSLTPYTSITTTQETNLTSQQQLPQQYQQKQQQLKSYQSFERNRTDLIASPSATTMPPQLSIPVPPQPYRIPSSPYQYQPRPSPPHWRRTGTNAMNQSIGYASEPTIDYVQRDYYQPNRTNPIERRFEQKQEPRVLHYYTGYDYFATIDPVNTVLTRHHPSTMGPGPTIRYSGNPSYHPQNDYIKSTL